MARSPYGKWESDSMALAIAAVRNGDMGLNAAARMYDVPKATLSRHETNQNIYASEETKFHGGVTVLGEALETELVSYILNMEERFFGLTMDEVRKLAFEIAERNQIPHSFNKDKGLAGKKWYYKFMKRHKELSLREPESTSLARAQGFNKSRVEAFFTLLQNIYDREKLTPDRLYNMDETVQDGQRKIVGRKGKKQIGTVTSAERGQSSTCVVCVNAAGTYVPPMVIFKRKLMKAELGNGGPPGALYTCQEKGWMSNEGFNTWLHHFISYVKPSKDNTVILILDGHVSHTKDLQAINLARENFVIMVSLPPHTTHKLQPLDVAFFGPFNHYYDEAIRTWMRQHVGRAVTVWQVAEILGASYGKAASVRNAVSGFQKTGLRPLTMDVFQDCEFSPSLLTDQNQDGSTETVQVVETDESNADKLASTTTLPPTVELVPQETNEPPISTERPTPSTSEAEFQGVNDSTPAIQDIQVLDDPSTSSVTEKSGHAESAVVLVVDLAPMPTPDVSVRKRKYSLRNHSKASEITSSPYKSNLEEMQKKKQKPDKQTSSKGKANKITKGTNSKKGKAQKAAKHKKKPKNAVHEDEDTECIFCNEKFSITGGKWIRCEECHMWAHEECAYISGEGFVCDLCA